MAQAVQNLPAMQESWVHSLGWEDSLEKAMATHSSILAWRIPWMEEPGSLQSMGSQSRTRLSDFTSYIHKRYLFFIRSFVDGHRIIVQLHSIAFFCC